MSDAGARYHPSFPNIPLTRSVAEEGVQLICDVTQRAVKPGDILWSSREQDVDVLEPAMPEIDVRFHPKFPETPLYKGMVTPDKAGKLICDVTNVPVKAGDVIWSNRDLDVDVLAAAFQSTGVALPGAGLAPRPVPGAGLAPRGAATAVNGLNQMGMELLHSILTTESGNKFISPLSISLALSMTANGARGETLDGMMKALCAHELGGLEPLNAQMQGLTSALTSSDPRVAFHLANSLWSQTLLETFIATCASVYSAEAIQATPDVAAINRWCADKTQNKINGVVKPPLDPHGAVLVNALYFKGEWKTKFDERDTRASTFFDVSGGRLDCQMMTAKGEKDGFDYAETDTYQMVSLPYGDNGDYSAVIVLPRGDSSPTLEMSGFSRGDDTVPGAAKAPRSATVSEVLLEIGIAWHSEVQRTKGTLRFPRFKVESEFELKPLLEARGMSLAFTDAADFQNISSVGLTITKVVHKTFVEVNEEGTEAAAVTAVVMSRSLPPPEPRFTMVCERPFFFFIRHNLSKAMIFAGVVATPA